MASLPIADRGTGARGGTAGALRRARLRAVALVRTIAGVRAVASLALVLWVTLPFAAIARPQIIAGREFTPCPDAVLPLRIATFQAAPGETLDVLEWIGMDEFKWSHAYVSVGFRASPLSIAVLAYVGSLAETMLVEIATPEGEVTWRAEVVLEPPDSGVLTLTFHPYYAVVEVPRGAWRAAFPENGPYVITARRPDTPGYYLDGFCGAEARSWVLVVR